MAFLRCNKSYIKKTTYHSSEGNGNRATTTQYANYKIETKNIKQHDRKVKYKKTKRQINRLRRMPLRHRKWLLRLACTKYNVKLNNLNLADLSVKTQSVVVVHVKGCRQQSPAFLFRRHLTYLDYIYIYIYLDSNNIHCSVEYSVSAANFTQEHRPMEMGMGSRNCQKGP